METNSLQIPALALADLTAARVACEEALKDYNSLASMAMKMLGLDPSLPHQVDWQKGTIIPFVPRPPEPTPTESPDAQ